MDENPKQPDMWNISRKFADLGPLGDVNANMELTDLRWIRDLILRFKQDAPKDQIKGFENWLDIFTNSEPDFKKGSQPPFLNTLSFAVLVDYEILGRLLESLFKKETFSIALELCQRIMNGYKGVFGFNYFQDILEKIGIPSNSFSTQDYTQATVITEDICNALLNKTAIGTGSNPPFVLTLTIQFHIGTIFMRQNKLNEALLILKDAHQKRSTSLGPSHLESILVEIEIASCYLLSKKEIKAFELFKSIYKMLDTIYGSTHEKTMHVQLSIVRILVEWGNAKEALIVTEDVASKRELTLGTDDLATITAQEMLASIHLMLGDWDRSFNRYSYVHSKRTKLLGPSHPETIEAHLLLAGMLECRESHAEALREYKILNPLLEATLGPDHEQTFTALCQTAFCYQALEKTEEALDLYRIIHEKQKTAEGRGPCHEETLETQFTIAMLLAKTGKLRDALDILEDHYEKKKGALGEDHCETVHTKLVLAVGKRQIAALEIGEQLFCSICVVQINFLDTDACFPGECSHMFHADCLSEWIKRGESKTCPECRCPIPSENFD